MHRKMIFVIGLIVIVTALALTAYLFWGQPEGVYDKILPAHPQFVLRLKDLENHSANFGTTVFCQRLKKIKIFDLLAKTGVPRSELSKFEEKGQRIFSPDTQAVIKKFFGLEAVLAFYLPNEEKMQMISPEDILSYGVLITRLRPEMKNLDAVASLWIGAQKDIRYEKEVYKKHTIHFLVPSQADFRIGYTRIDDFLVLGIGDRAAKRCVDVFTKDLKPLADDPDYQNIRDGFLPEADGESYVNVGELGARFKQSLLRQLEKEQSENAVKLRKAFNGNLEQLFGFRGVAVSGAMSSLMTTKVDLYYDPDRFDPRLKTVYDCAPKKNQSLTFVPKDVLSYQWGACYDFNYYWKKIKSDMQRKDTLAEDKISPAEALVSFEKKINVSLEKDILPLLGDEMGNALIDVDTNGIFPVPRLVFFVKITEREKAARILDKLGEQLPLVRLESEMYAGHMISFVSIPVTNKFSPGYAFIDSYLLVATDRQILKTAIDLQRDPSGSLKEHPVFQDPQMKLGQKNNAVMFVNLRDMAQSIAAVVDWANQWMANQQRKQQAFRQGQLNYLQDLEADIQAKQKEIKALEENLAKFEPVREEAELVETQLESVQQRLREREEQLMAQPIGRPDPELQQLRVRVEDLSKRMEPLAAPFAEFKQMSKRIDELKEDVEAAGLKAEETQKLVDGFEKKREFPAEVREAWMEEFIRPFLSALSATEIFANKILFNVGVIETTFYLRLE